MSRTLRNALSVFAVTLAWASVAGAQERADPARAPLVPGDRIVLRIWLDSSRVDTLRVDESGRVVLPGVGAMSLAGVPAAAVADSVRAALRRVLTTPSIEVTPLRRVGIVGDVRKPSVYFLDLSTNLRDAIALAGGVAEIGHSGKISVIRRGARTRVPDWESDASPWAQLLSGDEIIVGRQSFVERNALAVVTAASVLASIIITLTRK